MSTTTESAAPGQGPTLLGHPTGLFTLFFAEMWERFSYYGMRALLTFYMIKGFLGYGDKEAYAVYGAYTALVYMTPYFGGMLADRLLGQRRAVVLGGLLMAAGHLLMTVETSIAFFGALGLLIAGNGFFKPNISTMVGALYPKVGGKKDAGFTLFYMGINLGAAMSPILCGYVGETYGWHYGFGLATIGMLIGVCVFVAPTRLTQILILGGAVLTAASMPFLQNSTLQLVVRIVLALALITAGVVAFRALGRGGLPAHVGREPDPALLKKKLGGVLRLDVAVYVGAVLSVLLFALLVQRNEIAGVVLIITGLLALGYLLYEAIFRITRVERQRMYVVLILMFFSLLFWAFFEQAGSSMNNFADRNVDRVNQSEVVTQAQVGQTLEFRVPIATDDPELAKLPLLSQEQLGHVFKGSVFTMTDLSNLRGAAREGGPRTANVVSWTVTEENVGMGLAKSEIPASEFQAANPIFILVFGLLLSALWTFLAARKWEPPTPVKFSFGLLLLGLGFIVLYLGAQGADPRGMVMLWWLLLAYLLHTLGELCLSPVGLSMVTKLSPARMVSTVMGAWFLATAFSNYLAGIIASLTGVSHSEGGETVIPPPADTVNVYGDVFGSIGLAAIASGVICLALSPLLSKWMHTKEAEAEEAQEAAKAA